MADIQALVTRALSDPAFVDRLLAHPEETLRAAGVEPTEEMLEAIRSVDAAGLRRLAATFDENTAA